MSSVYRSPYHYRVCPDCNITYQVEADTEYVPTFGDELKERDNWSHFPPAKVICSHCGAFIRTAKDDKIYNDPCKTCGRLGTEFVCPNCGSKRYKNAKEEDLPKEGCFITTACILAKNLPDDCHELTTLRKWRDLLMSKDNEISKKVEEYYVYSPEIVSKINLEQNSLEIYEKLYNELVLPTVQYFDDGEIDLAKSTYLQIYESLKRKYIS